MLALVKKPHIELSLHGEHVTELVAAVRPLLPRVGHQPQRVGALAQRGVLEAVHGHRERSAIRAVLQLSAFPEEVADVKHEASYAQKHN